MSQSNSPRFASAMKARHLRPVYVRVPSSRSWCLGPARLRREARQLRRTVRCWSHQTCGKYRRGSAKRDETGYACLRDHAAARSGIPVQCGRCRLAGCLRNKHAIGRGVIPRPPHTDMLRGEAQVNAGKPLGSAARPPFGFVVGQNATRDADAMGHSRERSWPMRRAPHQCRRDRAGGGGRASGDGHRPRDGYCAAGTPRFRGRRTSRAGYPARACLVDLAGSWGFDAGCE
jgi:hypothetical protein